MLTAGEQGVVAVQAIESGGIRSRLAWTGNLPGPRADAFPDPRRRLRAAIAIALCAVAVLTAQTVSGQGTPLVVTLFDGTEFEGLAGSTDQLGNALDVPVPFQSRPIARIDDGLRIAYLHRDRMIANTRDSQRRETTIPIFQRTTSAGSEGFGQLVRIGPLDEFGHRTLTYASGDGVVHTVVQGITELNPRYAHLQALLGGEGKTERWAMRIATGSIPPDILRNLLRSRIMDASDPAPYLQNVSFYTQAARYSEAMEELAFVRSRFPDLGERCDQALAELRQAWGRQILDEVRLRRQTGQDQIALELAQAINREGLAARIGLDLEQEIAGIREEHDAAARLRDELLAACEARIAVSPDDGERSMLAALMDEFRDRIDPLSAPRLAPWKQRRADPQFDPLQQLALAISGWILGSGTALENYATAQSLFEIRRLVREYLGNADSGRREAILQELAGMEGSEPELLAALIAQMEPPHAPTDAELSGAEPFRFVVTIPGTRMQGGMPQEVRCSALVPPGYSTWGRYPALIVLPPATRSAEQFLTYWCGDFNPRLGVREGLAARFGFIVVAVDWRAPGQDAYGYSAREHAAVQAAVRESLRRFAIDSDRVVLAGMGAGGEAAYDVGFSHPDLFAGVAGISAPMGKYTELYSDNVHPPLCVYSVAGQRDSRTVSSSLPVWNRLLTNRRYNKAIVVQYAGRLAEDFREELPHLLRWASLQRRFWPRRADAVSVNFGTMRDWDNHFWFYELNGLDRSRLMLPEEWRDRDRPKPVAITIDRKENRSNVFSLGPSQGGADSAMLWLSPEFVDFTEMVEIRERGKFRDYVHPSRRTLLEDVRQRGDRQHPFSARLVESNRSWKQVD